MSDGILNFNHVGWELQELMHLMIPLRMNEQMEE